MDAVTLVSGLSPDYAYMFIKAMSDVTVKVDEVNEDKNIYIVYKIDGKSLGKKEDA